MRATDELLGLALAAGEAATALLLDGHQRALATVDTKSTATDMVSELDRASEALIRDRLLTTRPGDGFLGEESGEVSGTSGIRWVVDPLDGTTNYLYGHPGWNIAIAAEDEDGPLVGVVIAPVLDATFAATRGGGATRDGRPIRCHTPSELATALCATGFSYDPQRRAHQAEVLAQVLPRVRDIRRMGAAALDLCSAACGWVDAYWERWLGPWDVAAGSLVAREAGARVELDGDSGLVVAAAASIFDELHALLVDAGAVRG